MDDWLAPDLAVRGIFIELVVLCSHVVIYHNAAQIRGRFFFVVSLGLFDIPKSRSYKNGVD